ncbi:DUF6776 family protein [Eionea flava]
MPPVEPSPEFDLAVVPYRPYRPWLLGAVIVVVVAVLTLVGYYSGYYRGTVLEGSAIAERDHLRKEYADAKSEASLLNQQIANLRLGSDVDRKATEQVRAEVVELNNRIAELERDNTFYRDLMRPESDDQGISVEVPSITLASGIPNTYDYKMVVKQQSANRSQVVGYLEFIVVGTNDEGKKKRFSLSQLSSTVTTEKIKLNFKYFQRLEGQIILPSAFNPERIELKIVSLKPRKTLIEKTFNWITTKSE